MGLKSKREWREWCKSKPDNIPTSPKRIYEDDWISWGDWFGTTFRSFQDARKLARSLGLKSVTEWKKWCTDKPYDIPYAPDQAYKNEWVSWSDWLNTTIVANSKKTFLPFQEAREFSRSLGLKSKREWIAWRKLKPADIPAAPERIYKNDWISWPDWLGTSNDS